MLVTLAFFPASGVRAETLHFVHPESSEAYYKQRDLYFQKVLRLALQKSGREHTISAVNLPPMSESRSAIFLDKDRYNVHWLMTNNAHELRLKPVRIPLFKGLIGWRLLMIHKDGSIPFSEVYDLSGLRKLRTTQGTDWPDSPILVASGFKVQLAQNWSSMIEFVARKRVDHFPRSVIEIWSELKQVQEKQLDVEQRLVLQYPAAYYFFVSKARPKHAAALESGLQTAIADGSFQQLFDDTFGEDLRRAKLAERTVIRINNPMLPPHTPLAHKELWYDPLK